MPTFNCELGSLFVFRYLDCDLHLFDLDELECKFDVVYIDPPLEEYQRRASGTTFNWKPWTWDEVCRLLFFATAVLLAQRKNKPRRHINISRFYMLQVKIKFRLNFLTLVDFLFLLSPSPNYL